ncbi:MAG: DUF3237 domain-containing protein [Hyphomicrobiaceae bacterium]
MTPTLAPIAHLTVTLAPPHEIGAVRDALREVIPITGGTIEGPRLNGRVIPGGADWCLTRADGLAEVWARYTIAIEAAGPGGTAGLVMVTNAGFARRAADGIWRGHTTPRFETAPGPLDWLSHTIVVGTLEAAADGSQVEMDWFAVS